MTSPQPLPAASQPPSPPQWGSRLFIVGLLLLATIGAYYMFNANVRSQIHLLLGLGITVLSFLPALLWTRRGKPSLPVFEVLLFTTFNTYALPLLNGHEDILRYTEGEITRAAVAVIVYQVAAIVTYNLVPGRASPSRFWTQDVISATITKWLGYGIGLNTAYVILSTFTSLIPPGIGSILRAVFFGLGIICMFITSRRLGQGSLSPGERAWFIANLVVQCVCMMATLFLVSAVSLLLLTLVGYVSSSGRVPIVISALCLTVLGVLHNGKAAMRDKYWETDRIVPAPQALPEFYSEWFSHGLTPSTDETERKRITNKLIDRTSLIHILCLVTTLTPDPLPYLYGDTYADAPGQFVPRFFWPSKPLAHVSTSRLSVYYGLQNEEDTLKTTIGFGMVSEAYSNFGYAGVAALGLLIGFAYKKIQSAAASGPLFSYGGLFTIILLAWSFQVEFTLSMWLSSLYQATLVVLGIPFLMRNILKPSP